MNSTLSKVLIFAAGAAIGSAVTWKLIKEKYERIAQEEIDSVKEVFRAKENDVSEQAFGEGFQAATWNEKIDDPVAEKQFHETLVQSGYTNYAKIEEEAKNMESYKPYVITPEEFGELDGYEQETLTYYEDGVLADDFDNVIDDIEDIIGYESLQHFGEYEEDIVHVRNDVTRTDYEVSIDTRKFSEVSEG